MRRIRESCANRLQSSFAIIFLRLRNDSLSTLIFSNKRMCIPVEFDVFIYFFPIYWWDLVDWYRYTWLTILVDLESGLSKRGIGYEHIQKVTRETRTKNTSYICFIHRSRLYANENATRHYGSVVYTLSRFLYI